ncbi:MAG: hypothetical protein ACUVQH_08370, partial [Thermogutta sp.]
SLARQWSLARQCEVKVDCLATPVVPNLTLKFKNSPVGPIHSGKLQDGKAVDKAGKAVYNLIN